MSQGYQGENLTLQLTDKGIYELSFDASKGSVNIFNQKTTAELTAALDVLSKVSGVKGLLIVSGKKGFIAGADIHEFGPVFSQGEDKIVNLLQKSNDNFNRLEDLPFPTIVAIKGHALGGGCELSLACDYRIGTSDVSIGLPETKLGIIPGWGGTVRLPRLVGIETAIEWMASGKHYDAMSALKAGVLDAVIDDPEQLRIAALSMFSQCQSGALDFQKRRQQKQQPLQQNAIEFTMAMTTSRAFVAQQAGRHYPAPLKVIDVIRDAATCTREEALRVETRAFVELAQTPQALGLSGIFLGDQFVAKQARQLTKNITEPISQAAVLGAGIMGGGIAYQSALKGIPVQLKDVQQLGLDIGVKEAGKLLSKRVQRGRLTQEKMLEVLARIQPTLHYKDFSKVEMVVEAVVEKLSIKQSVLSEVESKVNSETVLATNTSTISVDQLADSLVRPENFCGMHFFNPVHAMPLVEVIRGKKTSDKTIAKTVAYATAMGKKAIVVNDCPGFLVNRVLFPYLVGFSMLLRDGVTFQKIDKVMEAWGWPMGPAYLMDVIGIDTCIHAEKVMAEGFPDRMQRNFTSIPEMLFEAEHLGQKTQQGFYQYVVDKKGKLQKEINNDVMSLIEKHQNTAKDLPTAKVSDEEIIARMMVPMATELSRCLEEGIVASATEADMALVYGLGFPPFRGGVFRWLDDLGLDEFERMANTCQSLSPLYQLTQEMKERLVNKAPYYVLNSTGGDK